MIAERLFLPRASTGTALARMRLVCLWPCPQGTRFAECPEAAGAGDDCTQTMVEEKLAYYAAVLPELERKGITYCPITFSAFGRRHGTTSKVMQEAASRAARFRGQLNSKQLMRSWCATVTTALWRRVAKMVKACLPKLDRCDMLVHFDDG